MRCYRAELKREVKRGIVSAPQMLAEPVSDLIETMKVSELLLAMPKVGRVKVNKFLTRVRVSPSKTVGGLSPRQRSELLEIIRPYGRI